MSQTSMHREYKSALDVVRKVYCNEGIIAFYSGLSPALLGVSHLAIQFPLYEQLKRYLTGAGLGGWNEDEDRQQVSKILIASCLSKMCAGAATYPHEVIRTRLQMQQGTYSRMSPKSRLEQPYHNQLRGNITQPVRYKGILNTSKVILQEEGWRALYAGMGTSMFRAIPASAVTMLVYETVVHVLMKSRAEGERKLVLRDSSQR